MNDENESVNRATIRIHFFFIIYDSELGVSFSLSLSLSFSLTFILFLAFYRSALYNM